jgi:MFS family permease
MKSVSEIRLFRAFRNRNFALFFAGQSVSQMGTQMQRTALSWIVYSQTKSEFMLGLTVFALFFPSFLFSFLGGVVSDRFNRHKVLLVTQTASLLQALALSILVFTGHSTIPVILTLSVILGLINAFDVPARQPLVNDLVKNKEELPNALALNSSMVNLARLVGPALAGFTLEAFGAGICFLINTISFIAVIVSLLFIKLPPFKRAPVKKKIVAELTEGFVYMKKSSLIGTTMLMLTLMSLLVLPYDTLLPVFATETFKGDASVFGIISSFFGAGAVVATLFLASLKPGTDLKPILLINTFILGIGLICFSHMHVFFLAMLFGVISGFGAMSQTTICLTIIQVHTEAHMRGRIISFLAMSIFGMLPLGSLMVGLVSHYAGAPNTILAEGIIALVLACVFFNFLGGNKLRKKDKPKMEQIEDELIKTI